RVDDLTSLAARSRILSVHAPDTPSTRGLISAEVLQSLPNGSTFINTARGALVDQQALVAELETGRLRAILDVTEPEVLPPGHPLYFLPNVLLTPHMAGSMGTELRRLGASALREALRVQQGEDILHPIPAQEVSAWARSTIRSFTASTPIRPSCASETTTTWPPAPSNIIPQCVCTTVATSSTGRFSVMPSLTTTCVGCRTPEVCGPPA